jgi:hypothetical protein
MAAQRAQPPLYRGQHQIDVQERWDAANHAEQLDPLCYTLLKRNLTASTRTFHCDISSPIRSRNALENLW